MIKSYALIIGTMKSGTTTLFDLLSQHPEISHSKDKEVGFFAFEEKWCLGFDWYDKHFDFDARAHKYALEASTDYMKYPFSTGIQQRLKSCPNKKFKLICILRNPLSRIESHARHVQRTRKEIGQSPSPRLSHSLDSGVSNVSMAISNYYLQLEQYEPFINDADLHILTLEQLKNNPEKALESIVHFLKINSDFKFDLSIRSNDKSNIIANHSLINYFGNDSLFNLPIRKIIPKPLRKVIKNITGKTKVVEGRFSLTEKEKSELLKELAPSLISLRDKYHVDIYRDWGIELDKG